MLSAQQLCLGKVGDPLNFGADRCYHGNDIWARRRDLDAYRLVILSFTDRLLPADGKLFHIHGERMIGIK